MWRAAATPPWAMPQNSPVYARDMPGRQRTIPLLPESSCSKRVVLKYWWPTKRLTISLVARRSQCVLYTRAQQLPSVWQVPIAPASPGPQQMRLGPQA